MKIEFKGLEQTVKGLVSVAARDSSIAYWCDEVKVPPNNRLPIRFRDGVTGWHMLTARKLARGTALMASLFPRKFCKLLTERDNYDSLNLGDLLIQLSLFGREVYGGST